MKRIAMILLIGLAIFIFSCEGLALEREIYIGDLIELKISNTYLSKVKIRDQFKEFEIDYLTKANNGYQIGIRSFETGDKVVNLGDKKLKISIKSTLDEISREGIYDSNLEVKTTSTILVMKYLLIFLLGIVLLFLIIYVIRLVKARRLQSLDPYQEFQNQLAKVDSEAQTYFVILTTILKEYIAKSFELKIKGKTSVEIIKELQNVSQLEGSLEEIQVWLKSIDNYKYTTRRATKKEKEEKYQKLVEIVKGLEVKRGVRDV